MNVTVRRAVCLTVVLLAVAALPAAAQPVADGVVNAGEYSHWSGDWHMAWDATYLYFAKTNLATGGVVLHLDVDPRSLPASGTAANGNLDSAPTLYGAATTPYTPKLPFRGDVRVVAGPAGEGLSIRDGAGGWIAGDETDLDTAFGDMVVELRVRWDGLPALTTLPESFNWVAHQVFATDVTQANTPMPAANTSGGARLEYFYNVGSTSTPTYPFGDRASTWLVTNEADSGTYTLRAAIDSANNDDGSLHRFVAFDLTNTTINVATSLPMITRSTSLDGNGVVTINGPGANQNIDGLNAFGAPNCEIRGLQFSNLARAIIIGNGSHFSTIVGNRIGLGGANLTGIQVTSANDTTIGGTNDGDRNVISGNTTGILLYATFNTHIVQNYIGTDATGAIAVPNFNGIEITNDSDALVSGNVISGNDNDGITVANSGSTSVLANLIGVAANGTTALGNDGDGIHATNMITIGALGAGNVIAHNGAAGVRATGGELVIRFNSIFANATNVALTNAQAAPVITQASSGDGSNLGIKYTLATSNLTATTQSFQFDLYRNDNGPKTLVASRIMGTGDGQWFVGSGFAPGDSLILMVTAYEDLNATNAGDGTSMPSTAFVVGNGTATTTTLTSSKLSPWSGESYLLTATIADYDPFNMPAGTMTFFENGTPVCENVAVIGSQVQCSRVAGTEGVKHFEAVYSGDAFNDGSSDTEDVTVKMHTFTGTGNFTDTARWTDNVLPAEGENFRVQGTATFDALSHFPYGSMELAAGGTMKTSSVYTTTLRVTSILGSGTLDMTGGGYFLYSGTFADSVIFVRGTGSVSVSGTSPLPARAFTNLAILGTITSFGPVNVHGNLAVTSGASFQPTHLVTMNGAEIRNEGTLTFASLNIATGATTTVFHNFTATALDVDGTLEPHDSTIVISGSTLTGSGKVIVTSAAAPKSFAAQYTAATKDLATLTVEYYGHGAGTQSIDNLAYANLILNNIDGASLASGNATVAGVLTLTEGVLNTGSPLGDLHVTNSAQSAVTFTNGWISGTGFYRKIAAGTNSGYVFPIGFAFPAAKTFMTVKFYDVPAPELVNGGAYTPASIGATANGTGLNPARDANVFWRISNSTASSFDFTLNYASVVDPAAIQTRFVFRSRHTVNGQNVWMHTSGSPTTGVITASNVSRNNTSILWLTTGNQLADATKTEIVAAPEFIVSNGQSTATIYVHVRDALSVPMNVVGDTVALQTTLGTLGNVTATGSNPIVYTATLTAGNTAGNATVTGTVNGTAINDNAIVTFGALGDPTNFTATAGANWVMLSWTHASGATGYSIERKSFGGAFTPIATTNANGYQDNTTAADTAYLYRIRATNGPTVSNYSNIDLATTVSFTDGTITAGSSAIKAAHLLQLRTAVNAVRALAGLSSFTFSSAPVAGGTFRKSHVQELRDNLDPARSLLGLAPISYTDPTITLGVTRMKAAHITQLRAGVQ